MNPSRLFRVSGMRVHGMVLASQMLSLTPLWLPLGSREWVLAFTPAHCTPLAQGLAAQESQQEVPCVTTSPASGSWRVGARPG